ELARMAGQRTAVREHHRPGHVGWSSPKLAIDEIGDAAEKQPDRADRAGDIADRQDREAAGPGEQHDRHDATKAAAMKRHAPLPEAENFERVGDEIAQVVEQYIADAPA